MKQNNMLITVEAKWFTIFSLLLCRFEKFHNNFKKCNDSILLHTLG